MHEHPQGETEEHADPFSWAWVGGVLGFIARAPLRHRRLSAAVFSGTLVLAIVLMIVMPYRYKVEAVVLAQRTPMMTSLSNPSMNRGDDAPTRAAREVVIERENLVALCKHINFVDRYLATRSPIVRMRDAIVGAVTRKEKKPGAVLDALVHTLQDRLWISTAGEGTINMAFEWSNPELALDVVETALQTFVEARRVAEIEAIGETIAVLEHHDERIRGEIAATVAQVEQKETAFRGPARAARSAPVAHPQQPEDAAELARLQATLTARHRALADVEKFREQRLREMQAQLVQQQTIYAPNHPLVAGTKQIIENLSRPSPQTEALREQVAELEAEVVRRGGRRLPSTADEARLAETRRILQLDDPRLAVERRQLEDFLREHSSLLQRIDTARVEMDTAEAAFKHRYKIVMPPQLPEHPAKPYTLIYLLGGLMGSIAMTFLATAAVDVRRGRVLEPWQMETQLRIPVLARLGR